MGSQDDLVALKRLIRSESRVEEGLDQYCVLVGEPESFDEWTDAPPRRGAPFAGDGSEHEFCLLDSGAVLVYTPLSDTPYHVVGADLREFLALLLRGNGAQIGSLGYDWDATVDELAAGPDPEEELSDDELHALDRLTATFELRPWPEVRRRLEELQVLLSAG